MDTVGGPQVAPRKSSWMPLAALWGVFAAIALFIHRAVGCPLAGCSNATIALVAAFALALILGVLLTHSDRLAAHQRASRRR